MYNVFHIDLSPSDTLWSAWILAQININVIGKANQLKNVSNLFRLTASIFTKKTGKQSMLKTSE
jgi:hypothetical protein